MSRGGTTRPHAVIGYVHPGAVRAEFCASLLATAMEGATPLDAVLTLHSGPNISTARNKLVDDFLTRQRAPWLLMVDTDMVFAPDALTRLVKAASKQHAPITGALCYSQNDGAADPYPVMYELVQEPGKPMAFARPASWPEDSLVRVSATGAAFLLLHREALEAVRDGKDPAAPWFRETAIPGAPLALMGEDMTFCLRAAAAGIPVHVHTGVQVGHIKPVMLGKLT
jgi:GT2 family glycosyltransferase